REAGCLFSIAARRGGATEIRTRQLRRSNRPAERRVKAGKPERPGGRARLIRLLTLPFVPVTIHNSPTLPPPCLFRSFPCRDSPPVCSASSLRRWPSSLLSPP